MTGSTRSPKIRAKKSVACSPCHSRKVKCDGQRPCASCANHGRPQDCIYPSRSSRKVWIEESYIDELRTERDDLRAQRNELMTEVERLKSALPTAVATQYKDDIPPETISAPRRDTVVLDSWFEQYSNRDLPLYIGEAACTAFATRARQALSNDVASGGHLVRTQFISDEQLMQAAPEDVFSFPSRMQASILVRIAQNTIGKHYYLFRWTTIEETINTIYETPGRASNKSFCKALMVFALGELYSPQAVVTTPGTYPGLSYFREAQHRMTSCPERCHLSDIEIYLMMTLYSLALNRRNSAFYLAGMAVKLSIGLGLHHMISKTQMPNESLRRHRNRIWWTVYTLDRTLTSSLGHPVSIDDNSIDNELPDTSEDQAAAELEGFEALYYRALIGWTRIMGTIDQTVFDRSLTISQMLQQATSKVDEFDKWHEDLPDGLKINTNGSPEQNPRNVVMLHLSYNQGIIVCTRASLHYMLRIKQHRKGATAETPSPQLLTDLAQRCRSAASDSIKIILALFVSGSIPNFDYFSSHYLFSASTIASIAIQLDPEAKDQIDAVSSAETVLQALAQAGNMGAREFIRNVNAFRSITDRKTEHENGTALQAFTPSVHNLVDPSIPGSTGLQQDQSTVNTGYLDGMTSTAVYTDPWLDVLTLPDASTEVPWLYAWPDFSTSTNGI